MIIYQQTIGDRVEFSGVGVHSGKPVSLHLVPAGIDCGVTFHIKDASGGTKAIAALSSNAPATDLATIIGDPSGAHVSTVEHLMAALYAMNIDNVIVEIDGREVPIMDGCSAAFVAAIERVGIERQAAKRRYIRVVKPVRVETAAGWAEFLPHYGTRFEIEIDFAAKAIGRQTFSAELTPTLFKSEVSRARTFGFMKDVERLWASGHALGSSLENSVVIGDDGRVINPDGLHYADEFVRHKALDAIGDQALAGARILGCYRSYRGGHKLNALALQALLRDGAAYDMIELPSRRRDIVRHSPLIAAVAAPAYGPQTL
ncbi:UDP-3-O-acyl-N-acetylglucosamine deacetylase [Aureimonas endophytica]|uniref:UDP-3-O-acyl-N-acetylglucosamine deacetylase n=1 Tax=Aureimonas endophytica TaxID=2027858 RepID=A0A917E2A0_9HYPH|nr:UDP-3-O-acyl-N-acetylglucosamine deacetylase [Aureimonas endophytica]GGD92264.1 UDP-3-O-acyl-N-acetylglucosamine deacetylase [Aureimonas endophytica]